MDLARDAEEVAGQLDDLVKPAREPENAVLTDNARVVRWTGPAFAVFSLILLPWIVYLAYSLPSRQVSADYDVAWAGFDVMLLLALAGTGYFALRRSRYLAIAAAATATLLVVAAWFDVMTTLPAQRLEPAALAVLVELPLASVCVWLYLDSQHRMPHWTHSSSCATARCPGGGDDPGAGEGRSLTGELGHLAPGRPHPAAAGSRGRFPRGAAGRNAR